MTLRQGDMGPNVEKLQEQLVSLGETIDPVELSESQWAATTQAAVVAFQKRSGLVVDGLVGPKTSAMLSRFASAVAPSRIPHGLAEILGAYGDPKFDGHNVDAHWEETHMIIVRDLPLVDRRMYIHKQAVEPVRAALTACAALGPSYLLRTFGCFAPRYKRSHAGAMSTHTLGIAFDLNANYNQPLMSCPPADARRRRAAGYFDLPDSWIAAWKAVGFIWGGEFEGTYFDPMHMQLCSGY